MLGHRGCRLGITYPEIYEMQARAILEAALAMWKSRRRQAGPAGNHDPAGGFKSELDRPGGAHRRGGRGHQDRNAGKCRII